MSLYETEKKTLTVGIGYYYMVLRTILRDGANETRNVLWRDRLSKLTTD